MNRFENMRPRGVGTGGGTAQTTGIIPLPVPYLNMQSVVGEKGKQQIEVTFPDGATSIDLYLKEGSYPLATNDVYYQKESFDYAGEPTASRKITLNAKTDGTYPYKLYGWAVAKNGNGVQTAIGNGNRGELDVYYASGGWDSTSISTSVTSYSGTTNVTVDGNLAFINTCAGLLLLDISENSLKLLVAGDFTEKPTILNPRAGVYLIKSGSWYEYNLGANTTTLLSALGTNTCKGEYGGYYFFTANINYKKSDGTIVTSCENASGNVYVTSDGVFSGVGISQAGSGSNNYIPFRVTVNKLNLSTMNYYDVGYYYENGEKKEIRFSSYGYPSGTGAKITNLGTNDLTFLMYTYKSDSNPASYAGWCFNGECFESYNTNGISWGIGYLTSPFNYDICGLGSNLFRDYANTSTISRSGDLFKVTKAGFVKVAKTSTDSNAFAGVMDKRIVSLATITGRCDLIISGNKLYEYRYNKETNTVYTGSSNFYYDIDSSETNGSSLASDAWVYLGYYNGKHWRNSHGSIFYLRDDGYWQKIISGAGYEGVAVFSGDYVYIKTKDTTKTLHKIKLETNGTVEHIDLAMSNGYDNIDLKEVNGLIYIIPRVDRKTTEAYSNYADFVSIYNPADGTLTKSTTLRGGIPWGENKYLSLNGMQITDLTKETVEKVPTFNSTRILTKNLYQYTEPYNGLSLNVSFTSGLITLMYAQ